MKEPSAGVTLIRHLSRRIDEFLDEHPAEEFSSVSEMTQAFSRWLRMKEGASPKLKKQGSTLALHVVAEDVIDENSFTAAFIKVFNGGDVGILWAPQLFREMPMPDELREILIEKLRLHADRLEDRGIDREIKKVLGKQGAA